MLSGHAQVKAKSIKYLSGGRFELVLTDVAPDDIMELLSYSGKFISFEFGETIKTEKGYEEQPENGRLFTTDGSGVVEMSESPETTEEPSHEGAGIYVCDKCGLHIGELGENESDICPECQYGKLIYQECSNEDVTTEVDEGQSLDSEPDGDNVSEEIPDETLECYNDPEGCTPITQEEVGEELSNNYNA
jgi:hypothetical protein